MDEELEYPGEQTVILMEWGEQMASAFAQERLEVHIDRPLDGTAIKAGANDSDIELTSDGMRVVTFKPIGRRWADFRVKFQKNNKH